MPVRRFPPALWAAALLAAGATSACATSPSPRANPRAVSDAGVGALAQSGEAQVPQPAGRWPVRLLPHVDLWLHAFALLSDDTTTVIPLYRRGYRDSLTVEKNQRNVLTALDGNREVLRRGLARGGYLNAQFLPFAFSSWEEMRQTAELFLQLQGDPRRAPSRDVALRMAVFADVFATAADREWLRLFLAGVQDEQARFFDAESRRLQRTRAAVITAVDSLWQQRYRAAFERFLNNSGQRQGDLVLSLPIGGEGRTTAGREGRTMMAVPFPGRVEDAHEALYGLAHEATGSLVGAAVADNTTPAEQRAGTADRFVAVGQVVAGRQLIAAVAPELEAGYLRFYLRQAGVRVDVRTDAAAVFDRTFSLPATIRDAMRRQIELVLGGI